MHYRVENLISVELIPISCDNCGIVILFSYKCNAFGNLVLVYTCRVAKYDAGCLFNLIVEELTEILHVHLALIYIDNGSESVKDNVFTENVFGCLDYVGELAYTRGFNNDSVGTIGGYSFFKCL